jgi:hypothetical protein
MDALQVAEGFEAQQWKAFLPCPSDDEATRLSKRRRVLAGLEVSDRR